MRWLDEDERSSYGKTIIAVSTRKSSAYSSAFSPLGSSHNALRSRIKALSQNPKTNVLALAAAIVLLIGVSVVTFSGCGRIKNNSAISSTELAGTYVCTEGLETIAITFSPTLKLNDDITYEFYVSALSSRIITGSFEVNGSKLILKADDGSGEQYGFVINSDNSLSFSAKNSAELPTYNYGLNAGIGAPFEDEATFEKGDKEWLNLTQPFIKSGCTFSFFPLYAHSIAYAEHRGNSRSRTWRLMYGISLYPPGK